MIQKELCSSEEENEVGGYINVGLIKDEKEKEKQIKLKLKLLKACF